LSTSSEKTPSALEILRPEASVRTVAQALSSHTWMSVTAHSFSGSVDDAVDQMPSRLKAVQSGVEALEPVISKTSLVGSSLVIT